MKEQVVKCANCGHENWAEYRFCGMCGTPLSEQAPLSASPVEPPEGQPGDTYMADVRELRARFVQNSEPASRTSISGPSFLGIGDQPSTPEFRYLLEDEPNRGPGRILVALLIILALAGTGWWQVRRHGGKQWLYAVLRDPKLLTQSGKSEDGVPADRLNRSKSALMESTTNPNASKETDLQVQDHTLVPKDGQPVETNKASSQSSQSSPTASSDSQKEASQSSPPDHVNAEEAVRRQNPSSNDEPSSNKQTDDRAEAAVRKQLSAESSGTKPSPRSGLEQAADMASRGSQPASGLDDSNVRVAEKYLYGQGVRQDCGRALSLLQPAAEASNPKARSLLGTMYATGHCVPRDLPSSYRWFALALREQPNNRWISRDLQSIWNQMSDSEKQTAMRLTK